MSGGNGTSEVQLLGKAWPVQLPDYATREELWEALHDAGRGRRLYRVSAAVLGLCTPLGRTERLDYVAARCEPLVYGGALYSRLRERGLSAVEILDAAQPVVVLLRESLWPRQEEVQAQADFSSPAAEDGTGKPSGSP